MASAEELVVARTCGEVMKASREQVDPVLRAAVAQLPESVRHIVGYHFGWWDERGHPVERSGGKAIRPTLVLLSAEVVGGDPLLAAPAAAAVELVHNFSLLHDDVMDGDLTRRHRPTAWNAFGTGPAILAGDALMTAAFTMLATSGLPTSTSGVRLLSDAVQALIGGQSMDLAFERRFQVTLTECVAMAEGKTAALLGASCALGGLSGGADAGTTTSLFEFGRLLGLAFQHVDDLLGIWGDPKVTGKPVHADLRARKKSLPVVAALNSGTAAGGELAALYREEKLDEGDLVRAAELVSAAGGRAWSRDQATALVARAVEHLRFSSADPRARAELIAVARYVLDRDH